MAMLRLFIGISFSQMDSQYFPGVFIRHCDLLLTFVLLQEIEKSKQRDWLHCNRN